MFYFYGEWSSILDKKGRRMSLPSVFRKKLKECIITLDRNGNIRIYREKGKLPFSKIYRVKPDKQGRITIPHQLRLGKEFSGTITLIGQGEYLEQGGRKRCKNGFAELAVKFMKSTGISRILRGSIKEGDEACDKACSAK